ncbi:MAG: hypothetical protein COX78_04390 [Candidatus Levybacteria bacterium CG_4_10_14_0_2_um_filter_35_8]|nr:MAG: hypothetical protein COX78_04390 [Candidatus Levybacteria bacterium CG_4_10_14_0_2_um_filter_35_8]
MKRIILFLIAAFLFIKPPFAYAEVIRSFDVNITAHKNGLMDITETINYDFESLDRHGIYRYIPLYTKVGNLFRVIKINNVKIQRDNLNENFATTQTQDQIEYKIGKANQTISGLHIYKISYTVENGIGSNFPDHDEIYWNGTGNGWQVLIEKANISINTDFSAKQTGFICFSGAYGSKNNNCNIIENSASINLLFPKNGLTAVASFPVNTFPKSFLIKELPKSIPERFFTFIFDIYWLIYIGFNILLPGYLIYWYQKHKNKKRFGHPSVNFEIPKDEKEQRLAPALAGTIDSTKLERDDVVATIFDLAIRKYLRLEQTKKPKKILGVQVSGGDQSMVKLKEADENLNSYEKRLFNRLFENGKTVKLSDLKTDFYKTFADMEKHVFKILVEKKYYTKNPKTQKILLIFAAVISLSTLNIILAGILLFLGIKLNGRTPLGDEVDFKIDRLKLFLKSMDRNYKWQAEQLYVVEQMIPYTIALGYIDKFMEQLKIIKPDYNPTWYHGHTPFYLSYGSFYSSMNSNITTSAPSSSSGAGGGGFSGGGGGGGGGGSW